MRFLSPKNSNYVIAMFGLPFLNYFPKNLFALGNNFILVIEKGHKIFEFESHLNLLPKLNFLISNKIISKYDFTKKWFNLIIFTTLKFGIWFNKLYDAFTFQIN